LNEPRMHTYLACILFNVEARECGYLWLLAWN